MTGTIRDKKRVGDDGEWVVEKEYLIDGKVVSEDDFRAAFPEREDHRAVMFATAYSLTRPLASDALAVHPKQIEEARARDKRHGVSVDYDRHGRPLFTCAAQRRKYMQMRKVRQLNSYYGY